MSSKGFLGDVLTGLSDAIAPLEEMLASPDGLEVLLLHSGWVLEDGADLTTVNAVLAPVSQAVGALITSAQKIASLPRGSDDDTVIAILQAVIDDLPPVINAIDALASVQQQGSWPAPLNQPDFWAAFAEELFDLLLFLYLRRHVPILFGGLRFLGILTEDLQQDPPQLGRQPYLKRAVHWDRIPKVVAQPKGLFAEVYGWGGAPGTFNHEALLGNTQAFLEAFGLPAAQEPVASDLATKYYDPASPYTRQVRELHIGVFGMVLAIAKTLEQVQVALLMLPIPDGGSANPPAGFALVPVIDVHGTASFDFSSTVKLVLSGGFEAEPVRLEVRPSGVTVATQLPDAIEAKAVISAGPSDSASPWMLVGAKGSTRIELAHASAGITAKGLVSDLEYILEADLDGLALVIDLGEGDGFLQKLLGGKPQRLDLSTGVIWSNKKGFGFHGQAELEATLAVHLSIGGVLSIDSIYISLRAGTDPTTNEANARLIVAASGGLDIGPVAATVDRVGMQMLVRPAPKNAPGNLGGLDLSFGFKPPNGLGLVIDAGPVVGGGYIFLDPDKGQYAGVLELSISFIEIKAIGILDTKLPDGKPGFSFLIIITTEFTPIQLGFGFTLNGVGGMAGINRTMLTEVLRAGIKTHVLDSILFPVDPIKNANKIISDLESIFPPSEGRYVFGPMVEIGWGDPSIIIAELGVIIEVPEPIRIAILGLLKMALPEPDAAIVLIHLDVLGLIDFGQKKLSMDASLYDSRILAFTLLGDMALRLGWGTDPNFAFSVGGLNPRFQPPPAFPTLHRLTLCLGSGDNPRLSLDTYMALTSNSAQFGAHLELYASYGVTLHGYLGFDALFIFSPFSFITEMNAGVDVLAGSTVLFSIHLDLVLSGPTPWDIVGSASLTILFFTISVNFHVRFGDETKATLPATDTIGPVTDAFNNIANWSAQLPSDTDRIVSLAKATDLKILLLHPMGSLRVDQKVVPLAMQITMFGSAAPANADRFDIKDVQLNGASETSTPVPDYFAMGQFLQLNDSEKLTAPSYDKRQAGVTIGDPDPKASPSVDLEVHYETSIIDDLVRPSRIGPIYLMPIGQQRAALRYGAGALSMVRGTGLPKYSVPGQQSPIANQDPGYVIAGTDDLMVRDDLSAAGGTTRSDAVEILRNHLAEHPEDRGNLQVLLRHEALA